MAIECKIINPFQHTGWNDHIASHPESSIFHTANWAKVLSESYGYQPFYFVAEEDDKKKALIPCMGVNSPLTGKRGVSLPFTDYCEPLIKGAVQPQGVIDLLIEHGKSMRWKYIEMKGGEKILDGSLHSVYYHGHTLKLDEGEEKIYRRFRNSTKRNIKRAIKEGVEVSIQTSIESVYEYYRLHCLTRKEHGIPPQPFAFFRKIHEHIISDGLGFVVLAFHKGSAIAAAVYFHFGKRAIYKYGASDKKYQHMRANNLVMWEAIKWFSQNSYQSFCFGRTEPENSGLMQFKGGWGAKEKIIKYYKYDLGKNSFVSGSSRTQGFHTRVFHKMPQPLLNAVGSLLYRHLG